MSFRSYQIYETIKSKL